MASREDCQRTSAREWSQSSRTRALVSQARTGSESGRAAIARSTEARNSRRSASRLAGRLGPAPPAALALCIDHQHREVGGRDAGDPGRAPDGAWPDAAKLLASLGRDLHKRLVKHE